MCDKFSPRGWGGRCPAYAVRVPRPYRFEVPGGIFHVATRSVHEKHSFGDVDDRKDFLEILGTVVDVCGWLCKSYCLMGSHYHLIIQAPVPNLSGGMQLLNGKYAQRFNWRDGRRGHLFGGRFYSVLIETDAHLFAALRYVGSTPSRQDSARPPRAGAGAAFAPQPDSPPLHDFSIAPEFWPSSAPAAPAGGSSGGSSRASRPRRNSS